jgi:hypothetical protein
MKTANLEIIFRALQAAGIRYLVVGGVAVVAHGYQRLTHDLDLVLDLEADSLSDVLTALKGLGYRPRVPVDLLDFANPALRLQWTQEKGMKVFNIFSALYPDVSIDLFPKIPFSFPHEYAHAKWQEMAPGLQVPVVALERLVQMKLEANRPQDQIDVEKLKKIQLLAENEEE